MNKKSTFTARDFDYFRQLNDTTIYAENTYNGYDITVFFSTVSNTYSYDITRGAFNTFVHIASREGFSSTEDAVKSINTFIDYGGLVGKNAQATGKVYQIIRNRRDKDTIHEGTIPELIEYFRYTLEKGQSWQYERGNKKINTNPKTIDALVRALNDSEDNAAANGYSGVYYRVGTPGVEASMKKAQGWVTQEHLDIAFEAGYDNNKAYMLDEILGNYRPTVGSPETAAILKAYTNGVNKRMKEIMAGPSDVTAGKKTAHQPLVDCRGEVFKVGDNVERVRFDDYVLLYVQEITPEGIVVIGSDEGVGFILRDQDDADAYRIFHADRIASLTLEDFEHDTNPYEMEDTYQLEVDNTYLCSIDPVFKVYSVEKLIEGTKYRVVIDSTFRNIDEALSAINTYLDSEGVNTSKTAQAAPWDLTDNQIFELQTVTSTLSDRYVGAEIIRQVENTRVWHNIKIDTNSNMSKAYEVVYDVLNKKGIVYE